MAYATEMFDRHQVSEETYRMAIDQFGPRWLTELSTMMGYDTLLAYNANSFQIDLPEGGPEPVLPV